MKLDIQTERYTKIGRHKDYLTIYKTQLNELLAKIKEREASVERLELAMQVEDARRVREHNIRLSRAKDDALSQPLAVGQRFRSGPEFFNVVALKQGIIAVIQESDGHGVVAGKSLETISEIFYFDYPAAVLV